MPKVRFDQIVAALEAVVADPSSESKKAELNRLSEESIEDTVRQIHKASRKWRRKLH